MTAPTQPTPVYCYPDPLDEFTFSGLHIAAVRTHCHVHGTQPCERCLADVVYLGQHGFALTSMIYRLRERIAELEQAAGVPAGLPSWAELAVSWDADDDRGATVTVVDTRTTPHRPVLEMPATEALGLAVDVTVAARDALMGGA